MFGFGRKPPTALEQLQNGSWTCEMCDAQHDWPFDIAARRPDPWKGGDTYEPNSALRLDSDFLSEDFCVLAGEHFMVRCVLMIPVVGLDEPFGFGCWSTLSRENFEKYVDAFDSGEFDEGELWSGWMMNQLADVIEGTGSIALWVEPRGDRQRPLLWVQGNEHPLAIAQEEGITPERMLEIFRYYGHGPKQADAA